jgi:hypothetical protein
MSQSDYIKLKRIETIVNTPMNVKYNECSIMEEGNYTQYRGYNSEVETVKSINIDELQEKYKYNVVLDRPACAKSCVYQESLKCTVPPCYFMPLFVSKYVKGGAMNLCKKC